jgi:hypothetical protein
MKKFISLFQAVLLLSVISCRAFSAGGEWWDELGLNRKLGGKSRVSFTAEQRLRNNMADLYLYNFTGGVKFNCRKWLDLGFNFKYEKENIGGWWRPENRPEIDLIFKWASGSVNFNYRSRFEYRMIETLDPYLYHRNKIEASMPAKLCGTAFNCVVSEEMFYNWTALDFNQNRMILGINRKVGDRFTLDAGYMYRSKKTAGAWAGTDVLVTKIGYLIP